MQTNFLIRSLTARGCRRELLSPFLFGLRGIRNRLYLPAPRDLPTSNELALKCYVFDFGFNATGSGAGVLPPYAQNDLSIAIRKNLLIWAITATRTVLSTNGVIPAEVVPTAVLNVFQQHSGKLMQFFNKAVGFREVAGTGAQPAILKSPHLVLAGDSLDVDVQNLGNYNLAFQVALIGGEFE